LLLIFLLYLFFLPKQQTTEGRQKPARREASRRCARGLIPHSTTAVLASVLPLLVLLCPGLECSDKIFLKIVFGHSFVIKLLVNPFLLLGHFENSFIGKLLSVFRGKLVKPKTGL